MAAEILSFTISMPIPPETKLSSLSQMTGPITYQYQDAAPIGRYHLKRGEQGLDVQISLFRVDMSPSMHEQMVAFIENRLDKIPFTPTLSFKPIKYRMEEKADGLQVMVFDELEVIGVSML